MASLLRERAAARETKLMAEKNSLPIPWFDSCSSTCSEIGGPEANSIAMSSFYASFEALSSARPALLRAPPHRRGQRPSTHDDRLRQKLFERRLAPACPPRQLQSPSYVQPQRGHRSERVRIERPCWCELSGKGTLVQRPSRGARLMRREDLFGIDKYQS